jgi:hydroxymethylpyrimidine pyrophosphatase-like HAD family hydrolase
VTGIARGAAAFLFPYRPEWSWHNASPRALDQLRSLLAEAGIRAAVRYTFNRHLDVVPADTSKGAALNHLCSLLAIPLDAVLVAGDTLHDASMMVLPKVRRIVVENSLPDLLAELVGLEKFMATEVMANGVMEGLRHFGVLPGRGPR